MILIEKKLQEFKKSHVPVFGSWDCNDDLPFTQCFESQDKLDSCVTATLKIVISMSLVTCALPTKYWCQISTYYVHVFIQLRTSYFFFYHLVVAF